MLQLYLPAFIRFSELKHKPTFLLCKGGKLDWLFKITSLRQNQLLRPFCCKQSIEEVVLLSYLRSGL